MHLKIEFQWVQEEQDFIQQIINLVDENAGLFVGTINELLDRLEYPFSNSSLTAKLRRNKNCLRAHGVEYRSKQGCRHITLRRVE